MKLIRRSLTIYVLFASLMASAIAVIGGPNVGAYECSVKIEPPKGQPFLLSLNVSHTLSDMDALIAAKRSCIEIRNADTGHNTFHCDDVHCSPINL